MKLELGQSKLRSPDNPNYVAEPCIRVSGLTDIATQFFDNRNGEAKSLWERAPNLDVANAFAALREETFGAALPAKFAHSWTPPRTLSDDALALAALHDLDAGAARIVEWKHNAAAAAFAQKVVHFLVVSSNLIWPFLLGTALALRLGKSRLDLLLTPRRPNA